LCHTTSQTSPDFTPWHRQDASNRKEEKLWFRR
jgi:hypothetical protein